MGMIIIGSVVLLLMVLLVILSGREKRMLNQLAQFEKMSQLPQAVETAKQLVSAFPKNAAYRIKLAQLHEKTNNKVGAISVYEGMLADGVTSLSLSKEKILEILVNTLMANHFYEKAYSYAHDLHVLNKRNITAFMTFSKITAGQGELDNAMKYLEQVFSISPDNPEAHLFLALILLDKGDVKGAALQLQKCLKNDRSNRVALYYMAVIYKSMNYFEETAKICGILKMTVDELPVNIAKTGITLFKSNNSNLSSLKIKNEGDQNENPKIRTMKDFLEASPEMFQDTAIRIIKKLGYTVKKEIKGGDIDPRSEVDMIVATPSHPDGSYLEFLRIAGDVRMIQFSNFINKMEQAKLSSGVFITTSILDPSAKKLVEKNITVIDKTQLKRYLP